MTPIACHLYHGIAPGPEQEGDFNASITYDHSVHELWHRVAGVSLAVLFSELVWVSVIKIRW